MIKQKYSFLIRPLSFLIDLLLINSISFFIGGADFITPMFLLYLNGIWLFSSIYSGYYRVNRITTEIQLLSLIAGQLVVFTMSFFAYFTLFREGYVINKQTITISILLVGLILAKFSIFYALKLYRHYGRNFRRVIVIGYDKSAKSIIHFFNSADNFGYRFKGVFSNKIIDESFYRGDLDKTITFIRENKIDEIYLSTEELSEKRQKELIWFGKLNNVQVKLLPKTTDLFSKNLSLEFYRTLPVYKVKKLPFERIEIRVFKRTFDILFSLVILIFIFPWIFPIIWLITKIDSRGPVFFKQKREGLNGKEFYCYKFRSMKIEESAVFKRAVKDDERVTAFGRFLRKSSLDELPQFWNVLKGDMSVVGPRPHMFKQSKGFEQQIKNYYKRNVVRPGITGLAQVSGYRGEIKKNIDIENRTRLDIFYIENWSFLLDLKVIFKTVISILRGDDKAY